MRLGIAHNVDRIKGRLREGERVELLLARQGKLKTLVVQLSAQRPTYYEVGIKDGFGRRELRRLERWLGQELAMPD